MTQPKKLPRRAQQGVNEAREYVDAVIFLTRTTWEAAQEARDVPTMLIIGQMLDKLQLTARILDMTLENPAQLDHLIER